MSHLDSQFVQSFLTSHNLACKELLSWVLGWLYSGFRLRGHRLIIHFLLNGQFSPVPNFLFLSFSLVNRPFWLIGHFFPVLKVAN